MTYPEAIEFLYKLRWFGAKLGLTNTLKLAALAGDPHHRLRFIHVAGTNGKGSTCAMLEGIYRAAGLRVGLFTSPHLISFRERIQVNRRHIPEEEVVRLVCELKPLLDGFPADHHPTFFEVVTVMALRYFEAEKCDLVIWETGLGGRLDATNIVNPLASVITNIQYDHQQWLGSTLASIAAEKAGIIKRRIPVVTATDEPEAVKVIEETALRLDSLLRMVSRADVEKPPLKSIELPLLGTHQRLNAALAVAVIRVLNSDIPVSEEQIRDGLTRVDWPARLQLITSSVGWTSLPASWSHQKILLDGAHNPAGAQTIATELRQRFPSAVATLILGILADKNCEEICRVLAPLARRILLVPVASERSAQPAELAGFCHQANPSADISSRESLKAALVAAAADPFLVITGSLYLAGEALELLRAGGDQARDERALNEWGATPVLQKPC
jgi:dihydrofolate synthase/folylpolyglutamate synthase